MIRLLGLAGAVLVLVGAVGLVLFGDGLLGIYAWISWMVGTPLPSASDKLPMFAGTGLALTLGLLFACCATALPSNDSTVPKTGKAMGVVAGVLIFVAAVMCCAVLIAARGWFVEIASGQSLPRVERVHEIVSNTSIVTASGVICVVAAMLLLFGLTTRRQPSASVRQSPMRFVPVVVSLVCALIVAMMCFSIWHHSTELATLATTGGLMKPSDLASHIMLVSTSSILMCIAVGVQGIAQTLAALVPTGQTGGVGD